MEKKEKDILKLFKENGIVAQWKRSVEWDWAVRELNRALHERDFYKKKYEEMKKILIG